MCCYGKILVNVAIYVITGQCVCGAVRSKRKPEHGVIQYTAVCCYGKILVNVAAYAITG